MTWWNLIKETRELWMNVDWCLSNLIDFFNIVCALVFFCFDIDFFVRRDRMRHTWRWFRFCSFCLEKMEYYTNRERHKTNWIDYDYGQQSSNWIMRWLDARATGECIEYTSQPFFIINSIIYFCIAAQLIYFAPIFPRERDTSFICRENISIFPPANQFLSRLLTIRLGELRKLVH